MLLAFINIGEHNYVNLFTRYLLSYLIFQVTWVLRATKAFKHLFPAQLESQLAKLVSYERYVLVLSSVLFMLRHLVPVMLIIINK